MSAEINELAEKLAGAIAELDLASKVEALNLVREALHRVSPFAREPVDFVKWVNAADVVSNDYNPNSVAPPEMRLLERSIEADGYTMPVVTWVDGNRREVVDGFHRTRVAKESSEIGARVAGYLPVTTVHESRTEKSDRMASTVRHNRARGKHAVTQMGAIVVDLVKRRWTDEKIARELGMDPDEVLRLKQVTGLAELFHNSEYSEAWGIDEDALCRT